VKGWRLLIELVCELVEGICRGVLMPKRTCRADLLCMDDISDTRNPAPS
jgi:hypothetical protein